MPEEKNWLFSTVYHDFVDTLILLLIVMYIESRRLRISTATLLTVATSYIYNWSFYWLPCTVATL